MLIYGYTFAEYIDILKQGHIRKIQITMDGTADLHNARRFLNGGAGIFDKIVDGVDVTQALALILMRSKKKS